MFADFCTGDGVSARRGLEMHKLLVRQLRRCFGQTDKLPPPVRILAEMVDASYRAAEDRALNERSMNVASRDLLEQNCQLRLKNEQVRRGESVDRDRRQLEESVRAMERVLALVGHELRTPVAAIRATADFLLTDGIELAEDWREFVRSIQKQAVRLSDTLNQLLEATVLSSGQANWTWGVLSVAEPCDQAVGAVKHLVDQHRVTLDWDVEPSDLTMQGDSGAIGRLITNLLSNAVKHTSDGQIALKAAASEQDGEKWVAIRVQDTGAGIAPELLDKLGQPFVLNSGFTGASHVAGAGLGLAICKGIVAAHGGTLCIHSRLGQGTLCTARLRADLSGPTDQATQPEQPIVIEPLADQSGREVA